MTQRRTVAKACSTFVESGGLSPQRRPRAYWICRRASAGSVGRRFIPNRIGRVLLPSPLRVCQRKERKEKKRKKVGSASRGRVLLPSPLWGGSEKGGSASRGRWRSCWGAKFSLSHTKPTTLDVPRVSHGCPELAIDVKTRIHWRRPTCSAGAIAPKEGAGQCRTVSFFSHQVRDALSYTIAHITKINLST